MSDRTRLGRLLGRDRPPPGIFMNVSWVSQPWPPAALAIAHTVSQRLKSEAHIRICTGGPGGGLDDLWLCFDCTERSFGIWRATMKLYEADDYGAMGNDPIDPAGV
jgi:hypothetical protein